MMPANHIPDIAAPAGAAEVTEWCDLDHPEDTYRCITGERRGVGRTYIGSSPVGPHFVEAHAIQESGGRVVEACVRAQVDAWNLNRYNDWDTELTPSDARAKADSMRADAKTLLLLADAFSAAAADVERWVQP